jgi:class 3 adenylate cyclase/tetratricopeptide (TPR) repeat protein
MAQPFGAKRERSGSGQELRRLTVLFCDVVGSTELGAELDIEDYCKLIDDFQDLCQQKIDEAGGWLAQFQGDGVLAYFGYPKLFEDPARRAVHAGLAIVDELKSRTFRLPSHTERWLSARVSVHTGPVVIPKESGMSPQLPEGMSVNIAKKAQQFAPNNCVVITSEVEKRIQPYFELKSPRLVAIDHITDHFPIYEVISERPHARPPTKNLPPIVARHGELQFVDDRWEIAQRGMGQCILLIGEAGIGKSRLIQEFRHRNSIDAEAWYELRCTPDTADSAFFPFREFLAARLFGSTSAELTPLRQRVATHLEGIGLLSSSNEQALFSLLNIVPCTSDSEPALPAVVRQQISEFLIGFFLACSETQAIVLVFEDLHWADASTTEIIQRLALRCRNSSILIMCAQRPEGIHPFSGRDDITSLILNPLLPAQVKELVDHLSADAEISELHAKQLFELTGGNPLFVEQYVASGADYLRSNAESQASRSDQVGVISEQIPPTLQELITYRVEQLRDAKRVAQCASVLGQFVHPHVLRRVLDEEATDFDRKVVDLVRSDILAYAGETLRPTLCFRHALIREAVYETLLESERRQFHRSVAEQLVKEQPNNDLIPHEVIARHFALAQDPRRSIAHWKLAAAHASARFANDEALSHLGEALAQVPALLANEAVASEIAIREALTAPLEALRGWAAEETENNLKRLLDLKSPNSDETDLFSVYHGLCSVHGIRGEVSKALDYAEQMQIIADRTDDLALRVLGLRVSGILHFLIAEFPTSLRLFEQMASIYTDDIRERISAYYPANPIAVGYAFSAWAHALTGNKKQALIFLTKARKAISSAKDEFSKAYVEGFASSVYITIGEYNDATKCAKRCLTFSKKKSFDYWISWAKINLGYSLLMAHPRERGGLDLMEEGLHAYKLTGSRQLLPYGIGLFADALKRSGEDERALIVIRDIQRERRDNEASFFDDFNNDLIAWRENKLSSIMHSKY